METSNKESIHDVVNINDKESTAGPLESSRRNRTSKSQRCHWRVQGETGQASHSDVTGEFKEKQDKQVTAMSLESSRTLSTSKSAMSVESSRTLSTSKSAMSVESSKTSRHSDIIGELKDKEVTAMSHQNLSGNKPSSDTCADFV